MATIEIQNVSTKALKEFFAKGRFATVVFIKKDGTERILNGKTNVLKALKGGEASYDAESRGQVRVVDVNVRKDGIRKPEFRAVTAERVKEIRANGNVYKVVGTIAKPVEFVSDIKRVDNAMEVTFKGTNTYRYLNVPEAVVRDFQNAESKGQFLNRVIKPNYEFVRIN